MNLGAKSTRLVVQYDLGLLRKGHWKIIRPETKSLVVLILGPVYPTSFRTKKSSYHLTLMILYIVGLQGVRRSQGPFLLILVNAKIQCKGPRTLCYFSCGTRDSQTLCQWWRPSGMRMRKCLRDCVVQGISKSICMAWAFIPLLFFRPWLQLFYYYFILGPYNVIFRLTPASVLRNHSKQCPGNHRWCWNRSWVGFVKASAFSAPSIQYISTLFKSCPVNSNTNNYHCLSNDENQNICLQEFKFSHLIFI